MKTGHHLPALAQETVPQLLDGGGGGLLTSNTSFLGPVRNAKPQICC